jgi:hypothetical protein
LIEAPIKLSPFAGEPSGATLTSAITPAVAVAGDAIPNGSAFDTSPEDASLAVICAVPGRAISEPETVAIRIWLVPNVVGRAVPFHCRTEVGANPDPSAKRVKLLPPAMA